MLAMKEELNMAKALAKWLICGRNNYFMARPRKWRSVKKEHSEMGPCRWAGEQKGLQAACLEEGFIHGKLWQGRQTKDQAVPGKTTGQNDPPRE